MITDWIDVGEVSAERDPNLHNYFYDAGVSKELVDNSKQYLLLGRKGAGKTAVFIHLLRKPEKIFKDSDIVIGMSLQSYRWKAHNLLGDLQKVGGFQHKDSWRFAIYVEALHAAKEHFEKNKKKAPKQVQQAWQCLEKIFSQPMPSWTALLGEKLFGLSTLKLPEVSLSEELSGSCGEVSFEKINEDLNLRKLLNQNILNLTDWLESSLKHLPEENRIFLVFDRLDEAWIEGFIDQSKAIVSGLLHAAEHTLNIFKGKIRPLVFLREDIFSALSINDRNKLRHDCSESLRWTQDEIEKLVLTRINFYAKQANQSEISSLQEIFQEKDMRSRTPPVKHLFNRTMCRPRDMVAFLGLTFKAAKDDGHHNSDGTKISTKAIYSAEPVYSEYLYEELSDEWRNQNTDFHEYLRTFENLRYAAISTEELESDFKAKALTKDRSDFRAAARFLFENSIIGVTVGASNQWRYRCFWPNQAFIDTDTIKVHPGLIKRLGLTEGSSSKAAQLGADNTQE